MLVGIPPQDIIRLKRISAAPLNACQTLPSAPLCVCVCVSVCLSVSVCVSAWVCKDERTLVSAKSRRSGNAGFRRVAPGSRCLGARALTCAPARMQQPSNSHPQKYSEAPGPAIPRPARARNRNILPGPRDKLHTRNLAGARQTCGWERGATGSRVRGYRQGCPGPGRPRRVRLGLGLASRRLAPRSVLPG